MAHARCRKPALQSHPHFQGLLKPFLSNSTLFLRNSTRIPRYSTVFHGNWLGGMLGLAVERGARPPFLLRPQPAPQANSRGIAWNCMEFPWNCGEIAWNPDKKDPVYGPPLPSCPLGGPGRPRGPREPQWHSACWYHCQVSY